MGVCECSRAGCGNIMCKVLTVFGNYICYECLEEFKEHMRQIGKEKATKEVYDTELSNFMDTLPGTYGEEISIDDYFGCIY